MQLVASLLVVLWALRLGAYLFRRILQMKVDHRFDGMTESPLRPARLVDGHSGHRLLMYVQSDHAHRLQAVGGDR